MKTFRHIYSTTFLATCLCLSGPTFAKDQQEGFESDCEHRSGWFKNKRHRGGPVAAIKHVLQDLELSEDQRDQIDTTMDEAKPKFRSLMQEMRAQRSSFHEVAMTDNIDVKEIETLADTQSALIKQLMLETAHVRSDIFEILTPDQREQLKKKMEKRKRFF